jgi:predicted AAA+ superfamily ATPase
MYQRDLQQPLLAAVAQYPVVTVLGPRQSGKTTLVKNTFAYKPYQSLENPDTRERARQDPQAFLQQFPNGAVLDEVQRLPELLSWIQGIVDDSGKNGLFVLTGSYQSALKKEVSQSLAGRTAVFRLLPMSVSEIASANKRFSLWDSVFTGGYPRVHEQGLEPSLFYSSYLTTFIERDLPSQVKVRDLNQFRDFLRLLAGRVGQLINFASLGNDLGASANTMRHWLSALEASWVVFQLPPWYENFGKRVIKSPKIYFTDTGLACTLLGIETAQQLSRDPLAGSLAENFAIADYLKTRWNKGREAHIHFFRDRHGSEVDLLISRGNQLMPVEIKSASTFTASHLKGIRRFSELAGSRVELPHLIFNGADRGQVSGVELIGFDEVVKLECG